MAALIEPRQARSQAALERFLGVGEQLLDDGSFEQTPVGELAALASSSVGTFYRLVGDRDGLLRLIHDRFVDDARELVSQRLSPERLGAAPLGIVLEALVNLLVEVYHDKEALLRALIVRSSAEPELAAARCCRARGQCAPGSRPASGREFRARIHALNGHVAAALEAVVRPRRAEIGHPDGLAAVAFGVQVVLGALNQQTLAGTVRTAEPRALSRELTRVLRSYLAVQELT